MIGIAKSRRWRLAVVCAAALAVQACGQQELYMDLNESEANEMIAALSTAGISGEKTAGEKGAFAVKVDQGDFARAVDVLRENGLPRESFDSLGTVFKKEGFTSSALAERARLIHGLQQELAHTVSEFDGVLESRVHLAMPEADPLTGVANPPSASVFVKYRPGFDIRSQTAAVKALVTNSVEGLAYDRVSVVMTEAKPALVRNNSGVAGQAASTLTILGGAAGALLLGLGGWLFWQRRPKGKAARTVVPARGPVP